MGKIKDLTGLKLPNGTEVLEFVEVKNHSARWKCRCFCGNEFVTRGADISNGHTSSCGCTHTKAIIEAGKKNEHKIINLVGQRFGTLEVLEDTGKRDSCRSVIWLCKCDCGTLKEISSHGLKQGTQSCGCIKSKGELEISKILSTNNVPFTTQKMFDDCRFEDTNALAKFDFYVNNNYLIEFDGEQHFGNMTNNWGNSNLYDQVKKRDEFKTNYCLINKIPLIRIPYSKRGKITLEDLQLDTTTFRVV